MEELPSYLVRAKSWRRRGGRARGGGGVEAAGACRAGRTLEGHGAWEAGTALRI